jgi:hypothetical protein
LLFAALTYHAAAATPTYDDDVDKLAMVLKAEHSNEVLCAAARRLYFS